jgi:hypothetical protein
MGRCAFAIEARVVELGFSTVAQAPIKMMMEEQNPMGSS